jgi:hypothetical protein
LRRDAGLILREGLNLTHIKEVRVEAAACQDRIFEFGIRLDCVSEIGLNTVFAGGDAEWVKTGTYRRHRMIKGYLGRTYASKRWLLVSPQQRLRS